MHALHIYNYIKFVLISHPNNYEQCSTLKLPSLACRIDDNYKAIAIIVFV